MANRDPIIDDFYMVLTTTETLNDYDLGWRVNTENIKLNTNVYYMDYKNQFVLTGAINDVGAPIRATSGSSFRLGAEIDADIRVSDQLSVQSNATISSNKNRDFYLTKDGITTPKSLGNTDLSFSPDVILGNMITYRPVENLQVSFLTKYVGKQFMSNFSSNISSNDVLDSYVTSDINFVYELETEKIFKAIVFTALIISPETTTMSPLQALLILSISFFISFIDLLLLFSKLFLIFIESIIITL